MRCTCPLSPPPYDALIFTPTSWCSPHPLPCSMHLHHTLVVSTTWTTLPPWRHEPCRYDPRDVPASEKLGCTIGMSMTEKQGGSDVRANTTTAEPLAPGATGPGAAYRIRGHKWFTSGAWRHVQRFEGGAFGGAVCGLQGDEKDGWVGEVGLRNSGAPLALLPRDAVVWSCVRSIRCSARSGL
jgi:hypothetical protein